MYDTKDEIDRFILVAVDFSRVNWSVSDSLAELAELVATSGAVAVETLVQNLDKIHPAHYIGKGKLEELANLISLTNATGIVCDDELTSTQQKNLSQALDVKILDRTMIILDIFAKRANTAEGKVQVELAQLKYNLSHLIGLGKQMSRLGGGIGTRGPGEKKLEMDRRHINDRLHELEEVLKDIETHRDVLREKRRKSGVPIVALVGYTNSGKSTLMNALTDAGVLAENKLFATLDTSTRKVPLPNGQDILLADTVGFIQKLPHQLIKAFRGTLEELKFADVLLHVVDTQNTMAKEQMDVVYATLKTLDCLDKPIITVFNKMDLGAILNMPKDEIASRTSNISALMGLGLLELCQTIEEQLKELKHIMKITIPYSQGNLLSQIYGNCEIICEEHRENGTYFELYANEELALRFATFATE